MLGEETVLDNTKMQYFRKQLNKLADENAELMVKERHERAER